MKKTFPLDKSKQIKPNTVIHCKCDYRFMVTVNFRDNLRKKVILSGKYMPISPEAPTWMLMTVENISRIGIGLRLKEPFQFKAGDMLRVNFNLDNQNQTMIDKKLFVRRVTGDIIGCEFAIQGIIEEDLARYLMS